MKRQTVGIMSVVVAAVFGVAVGGYSAQGIDNMASETQTELKIKQSSSRAPYKLMGCDGKLAVYVIGKKDPELIFDIYLHHLPDVDRLKLEEGIEVENYNKLLELIEDYTS